MTSRKQFVISGRKLFLHEMADVSEYQVTVAIAPEVIPNQVILECLTIRWPKITKLIWPFKYNIKIKQSLESFPNLCKITFLPVDILRNFKLKSIV